MVCLSKGSLVVLMLAVVNMASAFYVDMQTHKAKESMTLLNGFKISASESSESFPASFSVEFDHPNSAEFNSEFVKIESAGSRDIYLIDETTQKPYKYTLLTNDHEFEHYAQKEGLGVATLVKNSASSDNQYRMLATVYSQSEANIALDIMPVNNQAAASRKRSLAVDEFDAHTNAHAMVRRSVKEEALSKPENFASKIEQTLTVQIDEQKARNVRAAANGQPISLTVEILPVADCSMVTLFKANGNLATNDLAFAQMRVYYAQVVALMNARYAASLATDPDLRIKIQLTNFVFQNDNTACQWTLSSAVGFAQLPTYKNRRVVVASPTLNAFIAYMNQLSASLPFKFDHAFGCFSYDIFGDSGTTAEARAGVVGFAPVSGICGDRRYSIQEDQGSYGVAAIVTHEAGHNLGSNHDDGTGAAVSCTAAGNYIMSPSNGGTNVLNQFKFSSCSIAQFKKTLLSADLKTVSATATCLTQTATTAPPVESTKADINLPGLTLSPNAQCQARLGTKSASFCQRGSAGAGAFNETLCYQMWCRDNANPGSCSTDYNGAVDGTVCASGKICMAGVCTASAKAPVTPFPFGDDVVTQLMDTGGLAPAYSCQQAMDAMNSKGQCINAFCDDDYFGAMCPQTCYKYKLMTCKDANINCPSYKKQNYCTGGSLTINGVKSPVSQICKRSCGTCTENLTCQSANGSKLCLNGGTCATQAVAATDVYGMGFKCTCPSGYTGTHCETKA